MNKTYVALPSEARESYIFNPERSYLSLVVPRATVNLVFDPEARAFGAGSNANYIATGTAFVAASTVRSRRGIYGVHVTNAYAAGNGVKYVVQSSVAADQSCSFSFDHYGEGYFRCYITNRLLGNQIVGSALFQGYNFWTRPSVTLYPTATLAPDLFVVANDDATGEFDVDGFQFERGYPSTFVSGDLREEYANKAQYGWLGSPHDSASFRLPTAHSGGDIIPLTDLGFNVYELTDWGLPQPEHIFTPYALRNGAYYHRSRLSEREISFVGAIYGRDFRDLLAGRGALASRMGLTTDRPFRMHFQTFDCLKPTSEILEFDAVYSDGLGGEIKSLHEERAAVTVTMPDPFFYAYGDRGHVLEMYETILSAGPGVVGRDGNGIWRPLDPSTDYQIRGMIVGEDYNLYALAWDGVAHLTRVMRWDGIAWMQIGPTFPEKLNAICWGPGNKLYAAGDASHFTGPPAGPGFPVFQCNLATNGWSVLGGRYFFDVSAEEAGIRALAMHPDGYLIVGGAFTSFTPDGIAFTPALRVAYYNFSLGTWNAMGAGLVPKGGGGDPVGAVNALTIGPDKSVWAGGDFNPVTGGNAVLLSRWHFSTQIWYVFENYPMILPPGDVRILGEIFALTFSQAGELIVGGRFNTSRHRVESYDDGDPLPLTNLGRIVPRAALGNDYGGDNFFPLQHGTIFEKTVLGTPLRTAVHALTIDCDNVLYIGGTFTAVRTSLPASGSGFFVPVEIYAPGIAGMNLTNAAWLPPLTNLKAPDTFGAALAGVIALTNGGNCNQNRGSGVMGQTADGNALLTDLGFAVAPGSDNTVFAGAYMVIGSLAPIVDTVDTDCAIDTRPILRFTGPGILYGIENYTNGTAIQFARVVLSANEVLTVDLSRARPVAFRSNGSTSGIVAAGSSLSTFRLETGENILKATFLSLSDDHTASARSATLQWKPKYPSIDVLGGGC